MAFLFSNCLYCRFAWCFLNRDSFKLFSLLNHRPSQHGADLLSLLSKLLDENTKPGETENQSSAVTVSLALQALEELCKAEVYFVNVEEHAQDTPSAWVKTNSYTPWKAFKSLHILSNIKDKAALSSVYRYIL